MRRTMMVLLAMMLCAVARGEGDAASLRAMLRDLTETFGAEGFPEGAGLLARAEALGAEADEAALGALRREAARANPLVRRAPIAFVARRQYAQDHHNTHTMFPSAPGEVNDGAYRPGGAIRVWDPRTDAVRTVEESAEGLFRDLECSHDATRLLYAFRPDAAGNSSIYERPVAGGEPRRLTRFPGADDMDPLYLSDGRIVFSSTRDPKYVMCNRHIAANLYRMEADGSNIVKIANSTLFERPTDLLPDGLILYDRWEYNDRDFGSAQGLWTVAPDGTRAVTYYGNNSPIGAAIDGRAVPGSRLVAAILYLGWALLGRPAKGLLPSLAAVFVMGVSAWYLLKGRHRRMARSSIALASAFGFVFALAAAFSGDRSGAIVARVQPMKLAAMEALYDGREAAPLTLFGILRPEEARTSDDDAFHFKVEIPKMLSLMSFRDAGAYVPGINDLVEGNEARGILPTALKMERGRHAIEQLARYHTARKTGDTAAMQEVERLFDPDTPEGEAFLRDCFAYFGYGYLESPRDAVPNVPLLFYAFRVMVGAGGFLLLLCAAVWWLNRRQRLDKQRWLLRVMILSIPLAYLASQAGWIVAEAGRQPWAIQDLLPVHVAGSYIGSTPVAVTFFLFLALFTALLAAEIGILCRQIKIGPKESNE